MIDNPRALCYNLPNHSTTKQKERKRYEKYQKDITNFLEDKGCMEDGHASERVVDLIEQIMKEEV